MSESLSIGEVARRSGVPPKTIRYYELSGLLPRAERARNRYRVYDDRAVQILRFVKRARDLGFSTDEVGQLLALWQDEHRASSEVRALAARHVARIDGKIAELQSLRRTLHHLVECCHGDDRPDCPILEDLADGPRR